MEDGPSSAQRNPNSPSIEELADDYFSSVNSIARKFIIEKQEKKENLNTDWNNLNQNEKDKFINDWFIDEGIRLRYEIRMQGMRSAPTTESVFETYPKLKVPCGAKTVQYPESEQTNQIITWRDEFSAPFSWDTKCQQNLGLYAEEQSSTLDSSDSNLNSSQVSTDLDSSELFSRVKDKTNRLSSGDVNIHINPTFNLESKVTGNATNSQARNKQESQPVMTQPKAAQKPTNHQVKKPATNGGATVPVHKPAQPPPIAPGQVMARTNLNSSRNSQSSISSRSSYSSTSSSRPLQPPPSKPVAMAKPSQPPPTAPAQRPADNPPPPPSAGKTQSLQRGLPKNETPRSAQSSQPSVRKPADKANERKVSSEGPDVKDSKLDLNKPTASDSTEEGDKPTDKNASESDEKVDTHSSAAFDFLLQW
ncbi:hypothetical protein BSL78_00749 [Apostichopus japonicus]|uniref:DUF4706 domain-containing protein n=1 Tax=Stichopus japonicus TaxID=307972 RepID=A0A2G8LPY2_STIJA|nr:hypothetical protein BSL78_00749 [Apostichopus japonicus]